MARIQWGSSGKRLYEIGVDRGVVYLEPYAGQAWDGLASVDEDNKAEVKATYLDGLKVFQIATVPEFSAKVTSFSEPPVLRKCTGEFALSAGLILTNQKIQPFDFTYRTKIGNDVVGSEFAYKLHLVYNAIAEPPSKSYVSLSNSDDVMKKTWNITTVPENNTIGVPTAHLILDSRFVDETKMIELEAYLYGSVGSNPMLPRPNAISDLLGIKKRIQNEDDPEHLFPDYEEQITDYVPGVR